MQRKAPLARQQDQGGVEKEKPPKTVRRTRGERIKVRRAQTQTLETRSANERKTIREGGRSPRKRG